MPVDLGRANRAAFRVFGALAQTGRKWTYTPADGDPFDIDVIYDEAWSTLEIRGVSRGGLAPIATTKPAVLLQLKDVPSGIVLQEDDALRDNVKARTFTVAHIQPDGMDCSRLMLNETT
jgi:hypothetical protein